MGRLRSSDTRALAATTLGGQEGETMAGELTLTRAERFGVWLGVGAAMITFVVQCTTMRSQIEATHRSVDNIEQQNENLAASTAQLRQQLEADLPALEAEQRAARSWSGRGPN